MSRPGDANDAIEARSAAPLLVERLANARGGCARFHSGELMNVMLLSTVRSPSGQ
jgi:hypothetical protein